MTARLARLCLVDGTSFEGELHGADPGVAVGEVVFTTGMSGYQEVLTDPSYKGQIVTMTAPQIGNTGANLEDEENARGPAVAGFVVRELALAPSSWRSNEALDAYLRARGVAVLSGVDTRRLTIHLRTHGSQNGAFGCAARDELVDHARAAPAMEGLDLVGSVTCGASYAHQAGTPVEFRSLTQTAGARTPHVVALDFGLKSGILRALSDVGCRVTVVPAGTGASEVLALSPDGIFLSNGPGDPAAVSYAIETVRSLLGKRPIFGICLGHQLLALAAGATTYKLKFGHRGLNQPVKNLATGRVEISSQNHGFAVDQAKLPKGVTASYVHLNDGTSEGLEIADARAFSVQFHPEACAGPHDTLHLFTRFRDLACEAMS